MILVGFDCEDDMSCDDFICSIAWYIYFLMLENVIGHYSPLQVALTRC
jgi:hypothetical protein